MTTTANQRTDDAACMVTARSHDKLLRQTTLAELLKAPMPPRKALLEGLLKTGESAMLWAAPGVGKTMVSLSLALAVAGGGSWLHWSAPKPRRVLIVDGEMNVEDLRDRFAALSKGAVGGDMAKAAENIALLARQAQDPEAEFPDLGARPWQTLIMERALAWRAGLVILDSFSVLTEVDDENSAAAMSPVLSFLLRMKAAGVATILVHHSGKSGKTYRGSSKLAATFEVIAGLMRSDGSVGCHGAAFDLTFDKLRGKRTQDHVETSVCLEEDAATGALRWTCKKSDAATINQVVAAVKSARFAFGKDIAAYLGMSAAGVSRWKGRAISAGAITEEEWSDCLAEALAELPPGAEFAGEEPGGVDPEF